MKIAQYTSMKIIAQICCNHYCSIAWHFRCDLQSYRCLDA